MSVPPAVDADRTLPPAPAGPPTGAAGAEPADPTGSARGATAAVVGDGTTAAQRARGRWRRWRWPAAVALLALLLALAAALPEPQRSTVRLAPDNAEDNGARAVAEILGRQGVDVTYVRRTADALAAARQGGTLLVAGTALLTVEGIEALAGTTNDLVLLDPDAAVLAAVTESAELAGVAGPETERAASCPDPDATAAGTVRTGAAGFRALTDAATVCFPGEDGDVGALLVVEEERRVTALSDSSLLTNARLTEDGNAALALRLLGREDRLVWYVPSFDDLSADSGAAGPGLGDLLPPWAGVVALQALLVAVVTAVWRGRRLGRLVTEPLPVTVRAAETTRGRGRLYRRSRAYGHAAAALRAGTASRSAARLGLPRSVGAPALVDALAHATGRATDEVAALLYGPPPTDDTALTGLARRLDELESEVHRP